MIENLIVSLNLKNENLQNNSLYSKIVRCIETLRFQKRILPLQRHYYFKDVVINIVVSFLLFSERKLVKMADSDRGQIIPDELERLESGLG